MPLSSLLKTIKIDGGVECTWCMKNSRLSTSIWSITTGSTVPSTLRRYAPDCVDRQPVNRDTQTPLYLASVEMSFITHAAAKILKIATYVFIIMDSLGATANLLVGFCRFHPPQSRLKPSPGISLGPRIWKLILKNESVAYPTVKAA